MASLPRKGENHTKINTHFRLLTAKAIPDLHNGLTKQRFIMIKFSPKCANAHLVLATQ
jgi:hypothetical protein